MLLRNNLENKKLKNVISCDLCIDLLAAVLTNLQDLIVTLGPLVLQVMVVVLLTVLVNVVLSVFVLYIVPYQ